MPGHIRQTLSFATAASYSTLVDIQGAKVVVFELGDVGTLFATKTAAFEPQIAPGTSNTPITLRQPVQGLTGVSYNTVSITASSGVLNVMVPEVAGAKYVRLKATTAATDGYTPYVHTFQE